MKQKLRALKALRRSRAFVLSTDEVTMMALDTNQLDASLMLAAMKEVHRRLGQTIADIEKVYKTEKSTKATKANRKGDQ